MLPASAQRRARRRRQFRLPHGREHAECADDVEICEQRMAAQAAMQEALNTPFASGRATDSWLRADHRGNEVDDSGRVSQRNAEEARAVRTSSQSCSARTPRRWDRCRASARPSSHPRPASTRRWRECGPHAAESKALSGRASGEMATARQRMTQANIASMNDLARTLRENPRFARLLQLAQQRNCTG